MRHQYELFIIFFQILEVFTILQIELVKKFFFRSGSGLIGLLNHLAHFGLQFLFSFCMALVHDTRHSGLFVHRIFSIFIMALQDRANSIHILVKVMHVLLCRGLLLVFDLVLINDLVDNFLKLVVVVEECG